MPPSPWIHSMTMPAVRSRDDLFQRHFVVGRNETRAGQQRLEVLAIFFLAGDGERAERAAVKGIVQRDDFVFFRINFVAVRTHHFECAFHGLGAGVAEERAGQAAGFGQALGERTLVGVIVKIGCVQQPPSLLANHLHQTRVRVAQCVDADAGDEVQITLAGRIENVAALAAVEHQRIAGVVLEQVFAFERADAVESAGIFLDRNRSGHSIMITWRKTRRAALAP